MRILEDCTSAWPQPEMQSQIDALRDAFSADTNRPFQLKASFPFGSPGPTGLQPSPPLETNYQQSMLSRHEPITHIPQMSYGSQPMTPPTSAGLQDLNDRSLASSSTGMMPSDHLQLPLQTNLMSNSPIEWNPTPIFKYGICFEVLLQQLTCVPVIGPPHLGQTLPRQLQWLPRCLSNLHLCIHQHQSCHTTCLPYKIPFLHNSSCIICHLTWPLS